MDVVSMVWTKHHNHYKWLLDANVKLDMIVADLVNMKANMKRTVIFTGFLFVMTAVSDKAVDELAGKAAVGEAMGGGPDGFFHGADGAFDGVDVLVGGADVEVDGAGKEGEIVGEVKVKEVLMEAGEFVVGVDGLDGEAAAGVEEDFGLDGLEDSAFGAVGGGHGGAVADFVGDEVEEGMALDVENIGTKGDGGMVLFDERGKGGGGEGVRMGKGRALGLFPFEEGDVGAVDKGGALDIGGGDG